MVLLKSLIVLLLLIIIVHFIKIGWGNKKNKDFTYGLEGYANLEKESDEIIIKQPEFFGGEIAPPIGIGKLTPSQNNQKTAIMEQTQEEKKTHGQHKEVADNALNIQYLKEQMDELVKLDNEAQVINENFKNMAKS